MNKFLNILDNKNWNGGPWENLACVDANAYGFLEVLRYLHTNDCPSDQLSFEVIQLLELLFDNRCDMDNMREMWRNVLHDHDDDDYYSDDDDEY
jgi:hypothetical protein